MTRLTRTQGQIHRLISRLSESESVETTRRMQHESYITTLRNKISMFENQVRAYQTEYDDM